MAAKNNLTINKYSQAILTSDQLCELLLQGKNISHLNVVNDGDIDLFNLHQSALLNSTVSLLSAPPETLSVDEFHYTCASEWIFPERYMQIDVQQWLLSKCSTATQVARVNEEYSMFADRQLVMLLRLFIYLIDYFREIGAVWGVGRGSSVSSYILYLIGVHRVDPLKYNLPISDYLR